MSLSRTAAREPSAWRPLVASLAAGAGLGWLFRRELLEVLIHPWVEPGMILEGHPTRVQLTTWFMLISGTVSIVSALPWLASLVSRGSLPQGRRPYALALFSYAAIVLGLALATFVLYPAFVAQEKESWHAPGALTPVPWVFIEQELGWALGVALASQLAVLWVARSLNGTPRRS